jgi:hypothetical protein
MDLVSHCPLSVSSLLWQPRIGTHVLTVVCKATYLLAPVECPLSRDQDPPNEADTYWNDDESRSLHSASDLVPFKLRAEILLTGAAHAPRQKPLASLTVRLIAGDLDKSIEAVCDRVWTQDGKLREGGRFLKMPLVYERAAGGPDTWNPVGVRADAPPDVYGVIALPNLQPLGRQVSAPGELIEPVGFGPIAPAWPGRASKLHKHAATFTRNAWRERPLPDIDPAYFNAAPQDQQLDTLRNNERLVLENLHPIEPRLVTSLFGVTPRARVERRGGAEDLPLRADTLTIDTDVGRCWLVWRGQVRLGHPNEAGRVSITIEGGVPPMVPDPRPAWDNESLGSRTLDAKTMEQALAAASPFLEAGALEVPRGVGSTETLVPGRGQAPGNAAPAWLTQQALAAPPSPVALGTPGLSSTQGGGRPAPPALRSPEPATPVAPAVASTLWGVADARASEGSLSIGQLAAQHAGDAVAPARPRPIESPAVARGAPLGPSPPLPTAPPSTKDAAQAGAVAASNAAAGPRPAAPEASAAEQTAPRSAGDLVKILWYDPACLPDVRQSPRYKPILAALKPKRKSDDDWFAEDASLEEPQEVKDRRHIAAVITRAAPVDAAGVSEALVDAVDDDGLLATPLVVVAGELFFPFDDVEVLKATVTAVTPFAGADKRLKEVVDMVNELFKTPWLQSSTGVAEGLTAKVKEAFGQGNRMVQPSYLESLTERMLLEQRSYQRRVVFGKPALRALFYPEGGAEPIPTYLPEPLAKELPMMQRLRARAVAEVHMQQDQYETHPAALRVVALARVGSPIPRRAPPRKPS